MACPKTKRLDRFLRLGPSDRGLLLAAAALSAAIGLALWVLPFRNLRRLLFRLLPARGRPADRFSPERIAWAVAAASRYVPNARTCLPSALAAEALLRREGHPARLRIGVARRGGGGFRAHAWVESGDRVVVGGKDLSGFAPVEDLEGEGA